MNYLKKQNTKATASEMKEYVNKLRENPDGQKLTRAEIMQFINLRPTQVVIFTMKTNVCQIFVECQTE